MKEVKFRENKKIQAELEEIKKWTEGLEKIAEKIDIT